MSNVYNNQFDLINMMYGRAAGHYFNDSNKIVPDYADGYYIRKAKLNRGDVREMLIDLTMRKIRLEGMYEAEATAHQPLKTVLDRTPDVPKLPHLEYKHKKGKYAHLYQKNDCDCKVIL